MGRKRRGDKVDGWIVVDKPLSVTSAHVVRLIKRATNAQKVGHGGTLDPLASGILPIGLGEATKTMPYIVDATKDYSFDIQFGAETTTDDREGEETEKSDTVPTAAELEACLAGFRGTIEQVPPAFSALRIDGKRAYDVARAGGDVELKPRKVEIHNLALEGFDAAQARGSFTVCCGKGTYVRSLARDIARAAGSRGHVAALRRTRVGPFALDDAISLAMLEDLGHSARAVDVILPITTALDDIPALAVSTEEADRIRTGQAIQASTDLQGTVLLCDGETPVAMAEAQSGLVRPSRVFNL